MTRLPSPGWSSLNALWVGKKLFSAQLVISPEFGQCGAWEESIDHAFFHCPVVRLRCKLLERYMVRILNGKFFVLEANFVCSSVIPKLNRQEHYVFLCFHSIMRVVIWTTRKKELRTWWAFLNTKLKSKSGLRERLSSLEFGKRWVTVTCLCRIVGASLIFNLDIAGS